MTLRIICRWAGAIDTVAAIAAFDAVVIRKPVVRFLACEANAKYAKSVPGFRWRTAVVYPAIRSAWLCACLPMGECDGSPKVLTFA